MGGRSRGPSGPSQEELDRQKAETERLRMENEAAQRTIAEGQAAGRRVRKGGRALLSDVRLSAEEGVTTLGAGPQI